MFSFNIINNPSFRLKKKTIDIIFNYISDIINKEQRGTINIVFLDEYSIKKLNKKYRKINKTTDVLSFHYFNNFNNLDKNEIVGEIILNENKIKKQAIEYGLGTEKEFYKLLIHSVLHILGFDHEEKKDYKIMNNFEHFIFSKVFEK